MCAYVVIMATLMLQSGNVFLIVIGRLVQGLYVGVTSVIRAVYIKEFCPLELAGKMGSIHQILFTLGLIYSFVQTYLFELFLSPLQYWRIVYFVPMVFLFIYVYNVKVHFPFETIRYLLEQGKKDEARKLARVIFKEEYVEERIEQL